MNKNLLLALAVLISMAACHPQKNVVSGNTANYQLPNTLTWKVTAPNGNVSWLFGTFHMMCKEDITFLSAEDSLVKTSDKVYLELDLDDPKLPMQMMQQMNMKGGKKLKDFYSPGDYETLSSFFKDTLKMPLELFGSAKPFFASALLYTKFMNCAKSTSVEEQIISFAKKHNKEVLGLELVEDQMSIFDSIPYDEQAKSLLDGIKNIKKSRQQFNDMYNYYKAENLEQVGAMLNKEDKEDMTYKYMDLLLKNRNEKWVAKLRNVLPQTKVFIAVGAGHLIGNDGLIKLLRKEGFKVKPFLN